MRIPLSLASLALALAFAPAARAADIRIGYVDIQRAIHEVEEGKAATAVLKHDIDEKQKQLDQKKTDFEKLRGDFEKQQAVLSDQVKKEKAADLDKKMMELQQLYVSLQQDLSTREHEAMKGIIDKMTLLVKEIAEADSLQMVLERTDAGIVWAQPSLDLTNELIRKYNARYPRKADAKPDAKPEGKPSAKPEGKANAAGGKK